MFRPLLYIHVDDISTITKKISNKFRKITIILNFGQIQCPLQDTFSACVVQFIRDWTNCSQQISSMHPLGQHINTNLGNDICSSYITMLLCHSHINKCIIRAHLNLAILWYIGDIRSLSTQTSSIHSYGRHINFNLSYIIWSSHITTILNHDRSNSIVKTCFLPIWYAVFVLAKVLVIELLLYMRADNISTPTSDMTSALHTATL